MRKQLEQMSVDLRELMVYQSPPELGSLYTEVEEMMKHMGATQRVLIAKKMQAEQNSRRRKKRLMDLYFIEGVGAVGMILGVGFSIMMMLYVVEDRIEKYPQYGTGWVPKTEEQRRIEALPKKYIGR
jgi:hypothetical protein